MYMRVESRTSSCLHLKRAPGIRSWSLLVGILSIGLAAAYYSGDSLGWKLFYVTGCLFVAVQNLEDWEEAVFNKSTGQVVLKTFSLYRKLLTLFRTGHEQVTWKPSPSLLPPSWNCTAWRVLWSCLRAVTARLMAWGARANAHRTPLALVLVAPW
ncbi:cytochrome b-245 chaperone 1 isoform X3 [Zalophus californianus]|uniref:Essential for reactive oxygen species protein n=1 Tax=Zalophus californianus TaxID=9704 RepID=A0A6J2FNK5_ZALCA|nr:cytochrome b-245 chaperone 1 isoform X3 [Zalophus californianus]